MCKNWLEGSAKKLKWTDMSFIKISAAAFILMIAKLWPGILGLNWYLYLVIGIVAAIVPMIKLFKK